MNEATSKNDIEKISYEILKGSKCFDIFPTPVDRILEYTALAVHSGIDLSKIQPSYLSRATDALKRALNKVRGALDRKEKIIYLDSSIKASKKNFVKLHEVGHEVLPWQHSIYEALEEDDNTLNIETREEFEMEANLFASTTLFQCDRFYSEMDKLGLSINSSMQLAKQFGASVHAALRKYVESSKNRCALLVLENPTQIGAFLRNTFQSNSFTKTFGELVIPTVLDYSSWSFIQDYCHKRKYRDDGIITLLTKNGNTTFTYHFFNNSYNAFVFLFPIGEKKSSRTKIIVSA